jgi:hypothetical protein
MTNNERVFWWFSIVAALMVSASITIPTITAIIDNKNSPLKSGE